MPDDGCQTSVTTVEERASMTNQSLVGINGPGLTTAGDDEVVINVVNLDTLEEIATADQHMRYDDVEAVMNLENEAMSLGIVEEITTFAHQTLVDTKPQGGRLSEEGNMRTVPYMAITEETMFMRHQSLVDGEPLIHDNADVNRVLNLDIFDEIATVAHKSPADIDAVSLQKSRTAEKDDRSSLLAKCPTQSDILSKYEDFADKLIEKVMNQFEEVLPQENEVELPGISQGDHHEAAGHCLDDEAPGKRLSGQLRAIPEEPIQEADRLLDKWHSEWPGRQCKCEAVNSGKISLIDVDNLDGDRKEDKKMENFSHSIPSTGHKAGTFQTVLIPPFRREITGAECLTISARQKCFNCPSSISREVSKECLASADDLEKDAVGQVSPEAVSTVYPPGSGLESEVGGGQGLYEVISSVCPPNRELECKAGGEKTLSEAVSILYPLEKEVGSNSDRGQTPIEDASALYHLHRELEGEVSGGEAQAESVSTMYPTNEEVEGDMVRGQASYEAVSSGNHPYREVEEKAGGVKTVSEADGYIPNKKIESEVAGGQGSVQGVSTSSPLNKEVESAVGGGQAPPEAVSAVNSPYREAEDDVDKGQIPSEVETTVYPPIEEVQDDRDGGPASSEAVSSEHPPYREVTEDLIEERLEQTLTSLHQKSEIEAAEIRSIQEQCGDLQMIIQRCRSRDHLLMEAAAGDHSTDLSTGGSLSRGNLIG
jgi:hypothetical protein